MDARNSLDISVHDVNPIINAKESNDGLNNAPNVNIKIKRGMAVINSVILVIRLSAGKEIFFFKKGISFSALIIIHAKKTISAMIKMVFNA